MDALLKQFGLSECETTLVGVPGGEKGLSGGQQKRLAIALEMVSSPALLFLDEPTSSLDSYSSMLVVDRLRLMAEHGHTVVSTIHQPSAAILFKFHTLLLIAKGETVYFGPTSRIVDYFNAVGVPMPPNTNPGDFAMEQVAGKGGHVVRCGAVTFRPPLSAAAREPRPLVLGGTRHGSFGALFSAPRALSLPVAPARTGMPKPHANKACRARLLRAFSPAPPCATPTRLLGATSSLRPLPVPARSWGHAACWWASSRSPISGTTARLARCGWRDVVGAAAFGGVSPLRTPHPSPLLRLSLPLANPLAPCPWRRQSGMRETELETGMEEAADVEMLILTSLPYPKNRYETTFGAQLRLLLWRAKLMNCQVLRAAAAAAAAACCRQCYRHHRRRHHHHSRHHQAPTTAH